VASVSTYRAVQAVSPGKLELAEKPPLDPPAGHVRIRVEACGVCHSDSATVEGILPIQWPRVPGHEAVGRIDALGDRVGGWTLGQRVGVGFLGGNCGYCEYCRDGDLVNCRNQGYTGVQRDGGYAEASRITQIVLSHISRAKRTRTARAGELRSALNVVRPAR
jgi:propanol-preferring alcohol dehydrogenase